MRRSLIAGLVAAASAALACHSQEVDSDRGELEVYGAVESPASRIAPLGARQSDLLRGLSDPSKDPTSLMAEGFRLIDQSDTTASIRRGIDRQTVVGQGVLATLAKRLPAEYSEIQSVEGFLDGPELAVVFVRHPTGRRSITYWKLSAGTWKASSLLLNIDEEGFSKARARSFAGS